VVPRKKRLPAKQGADFLGLKSAGFAKREGKRKKALAPFPRQSGTRERISSRMERKSLMTIRVLSSKISEKGGEIPENREFILMNPSISVWRSDSRSGRVCLRRFCGKKSVAREGGGIRKKASGAAR